MSNHSNRCLVLFSDSYPLGVGEEFLEQEIEHWASDFEKVIIIPVRERANRKQTRAIPDNVEVRALPLGNSEDWRVWAIKHLPSILLRRPRMLEQNPFREPIKFAVDLRFASLVHETYQRVSRVLEDVDFSVFDSVTIYSYWFFTGVGVGEMLRRKQLQGIPTRIVARAHAYDVDEADAPRKYLGSRSFLLDSVDRVFPISNYAASFLTQRRPDLEGKIKVQRLGVPPSEAGVRNRMSPPWIVSCSHMAEYKKVHLIADAVGELHNRGIPARWTHIGESDQAQLQSMRAYIDRVVPDPSKVELLGHKRNHDVRELYRTQDYSVFVNSSSGEGVPVSVMEAQAAGLPVVATAAGGTGEIVHDGWNGRLLPVDTSGAQIADAVSSISNLGELEYAALSAHAIEGWNERSNAHTQYSRFRDELLSIAEA